MEDGEKQVKEYGEKLEQRHGNLRLQKFVVVALGFERVCFSKLSRRDHPAFPCSRVGTRKTYNHKSVSYSKDVEGL
ncbi:MAG: hypothetical protein LWX52_08255 [Deltaproteobacteria bacterium]|jgi:hypothetical protein|nr:hypothetical protein [Deltaproteobacteria bacterium]